MRIALIQDHLRNGGTEQQCLAVAEGLARAGHPTSVIVFRRGGILDALAESKGIDLRFLRQGLLRSDWFAPGLARLLDRLAPATVIPMGRMANCWAAALSRRRQRRYHLIATLRTGRALPWLYRSALGRADHIVANSQEALDRLASTYRIRRPEASSVIHNGCLRDFDLAIPSLRPPDEAVHLCSISMFRPEKRQIRLVRLCARLPADIPWRLSLAGDGPCRAACQAEAQRLGLSGRIEFPGLLRDPRSLYFASDLALHVSRRESLPNFLVEAQMAGLPVVAYDVNGVRETFLDGASGFLVPLDHEERFLDRVALLARDAALRRAQSLAAQQFARRRFSLDAQTRAYVDLLHRLGDRRAAQPSPTADR